MKYIIDKFRKTNNPYAFLGGVFFILILTVNVSCKKLIKIPPPVNTLTTEQVFATAAEARSAAAAIYSELIHGNTSFANYAVSLFCGLSADDLTMPPASQNEGYLQFLRNDLSDENTIIVNRLWLSMYAAIYKANAVIERVHNNGLIPNTVKEALEGQAYFIRAFCNFYLVNLFGPVPLVNTVNWRNTNLLSNAPVSDIYQFIVSDLKLAYNLLASDYSEGKGERIIPNKAAAQAMLARAYLYLGDWNNAEQEASGVINNIDMSLEPPAQVFKTNSREAIWQLKQNNTLSPSYNGTPEGYLIRPRTLNSNILPQMMVANGLLNEFEPADQRRLAWIDSTKYTLDNKLYYFPAKYKQGAGEITAGGPYSQYYMMLRLSEQYFIRAEAFIRLNRLNEAVSDLNKIRQRTGLSELNSGLSADELMQVLKREKQVEFFAEWGHRWLDLKRWGIADQVLAPVKGNTWQTTDQLYPLPYADVQNNPNLKQNPGY